MDINDEYDIEKALKEIEEELIASMIRNLRGHRAEEEKMGYNWSMWQVEMLKSLEKYKKENAKKFQSSFSNINSSVKAMISVARAEGETAQEQSILKAILNGFKAKRVSKETEGAFFRLNTPKLEALMKATQQDLTKAEHAMLRMANDQFRKIIFNAQVYANTGAGTYEKAVDMATKNFLSAGINCIEYKNGSRHSISEYARMAIQTANKRATLTGEGEMRKAWGLSLVIINKRGNPCPKCLPFVGKVLIDDVWSGGKPDGKHQLMSRAIEAGLFHPRCRDSCTTYYEGVTEWDKPYTKEELKQIEEDYKKEQEQKYAQRQVEKYGRLARYALDPQNRKIYEAREKEWEQVANQRESDIMESDLGAFKERLRSDNNINEDYYTVLKDRFSHGTNNAKAAFTKYVPAKSVENPLFNSVAQYNRKTQKISMNYGVDLKNNRGAGVTWFHEHGHLIDDMAGSISDSEEFLKLLSEDALNYRKVYGKRHHLNTFDKVDHAISHELSDVKRHSGVSDILQGVTHGNISGISGHALEYWTNSKNITGEAFAHMYEAQFDTVRYEEMKKYFPKSLKYFERLLKEAVR